MIHYFQIINSTKQKSGKEQVTLSLHKKMKFFMKVSSVNVTKSTVDLVIFTEKIFNG